MHNILPSVLLKITADGQRLKEDTETEDTEETGFHHRLNGRRSPTARIAYFFHASG